MKQVFKNNNNIKVYDVPLPTPGENEIMVAVGASVISTGTEIMGMHYGQKKLIDVFLEKKALINKALQKIKEEGLNATIKTIKRKLDPSEQTIVFNPIGYSNSGTIVSKGRFVKNFNVGDRVACAGSGIASHAEYVAVPVNLAVKLPENVSIRDAAFTTIGSIAMQGIRRANVTFGETIVITGLGLLGLLAVQIAKAWGLIVIGLDLNDKRLEIAKSMGADYCFLANKIESENTIHELTNMNGADAVIIYASTKSSEPSNQAFKLCRRKGKVVVVGAIGMDLNREEMYMKELDFLMSTSYGPGRYDSLYENKGIDYPIGYVRWTENRNMTEFVRLISTGQIDVHQLISQSFSIDQADQAYQSLFTNPENNISCLFQYQHEVMEAPANKCILYTRPTHSGKIRVGIIGAGGFVRSSHLPNILKLPELFELKALANRTPASAKSVGEKYKAAYITTEYQQILKDPDIEMVVIGTRHDLHANQVIDAIQAGKHVLIEKPLAITEEELELIRKTHEQFPNIHVSVGFNRRYSSLTKKVKEIIDLSKGPIFINYRINAGHIPSNHWVQNLEEGGGRVVGEVCHFIDLVCFLIESEVSNIQVAHIPINNVNIQSTDNLSILLTHEDGSVSNIIYVSQGGKNMPKERLEVFLDNSSMIIDDFNCLQMFNTKEKDIKLKQTDKGHYIEIEEFAKLINGKKSLIAPFEKDIKSTELTFAVLKIINEKL
ncbi:MAG: Gfo/Idh/MocA family oxidoreductase [Bacteroidetes bacterium]|nr:Gfo/Idh/MocA family oxidoreductase [Bacteroidota bacterium]